MPLQRRDAIDLQAHKKDPFAHHNSHFGSSGGTGGTDFAQMTIDQPDILAESFVRILHVHADWAPQGIEVKTVLLDTGESSTYEVTYQIRTTTTDASPTTIATIATSASLLAETSVLENSVVGVGEYIYAILPATDLNQLGLEVNYQII